VYSPGIGRGNVSAKAATQNRRKGGGKVLPALCNVFGMLLLLGVIALCLPLVLPSVLGYQAFNVISGSMEPAIPIGSVIYVETVDPVDLEKDDIIAFYDDDGAVIAHRVTINRATLEEVVTKGDANEIEDFDPIPYSSIVGRVAASIPFIGSFMAIYASLVGKLYLLLTATCGVMLNVLAGRMRDRNREYEQRLVAEAAALGVAGMTPSGSGAAPAPNDPYEKAEKKATKRRGGLWRAVAAVVLGVIFLGSAGVVGFVVYQYSESDAIYRDAVDKYVGPSDIAPISVNFKKLHKVNPDVVGWIYCEGTAIDYPVLMGKDNDQYLHTDYKGEYNMNGSIFVDADNTPGFTDSNTIIYGHHMANGSMFAGLEKWGDQEYYEEHPIIWLITPAKVYQIVLFSGHHTASTSSMYDIITHPGAQMDAFLSEALEKSEFEADVTLNRRARYVMLSTCAYLFDGDRYVLHGYLVTVTGKQKTK